MVDDFTSDFLSQVCQEVEGKQVKAKENKIDYQHCEKCNVERMMYPHLGFWYDRAVVCAAMIYVLKDTMNQQSCTKRGNVFILNLFTPICYVLFMIMDLPYIYKRYKYFQLKIGKFYIENLLRSQIV